MFCSEFSKIVLPLNTTVFLNLFTLFLIKQGKLYQNNLFLVMNLICFLKTNKGRNPYITLFNFLQTYVLRVTLLNIEIKGKQAKIPIPSNLYFLPYKTFIKEAIKSTKLRDKNYKNFASNFVNLMEETLQNKGPLYKN